MVAAKAFVLSSLQRLEDARRAVEAEQTVAEQLAQPDRLAMASHDRGLVALEEGEWELAAQLLGASLFEQAPISRPVTRIALAEALARGGHAEQAAEEVRAAVLEPVSPGDFPATLVPRLARVQGLIACAREDYAEAARRFEESIAGWERLLAANLRADSLAGVLANLGRPVVGLVEPERELARARADLDTIRNTGERVPSFHDTTRSSAPPEEVWKLLSRPGTVSRMVSGVGTVDREAPTATRCIPRAIRTSRWPRS